mmetsp:Transcript_17890/g.44355  ORF Transcript_17890/g.44355 Transcript_17890/m.44355 type:complete len:649 (-) Transcript_17890:538-2484(-)
MSEGGKSSENEGGKREGKEEESQYLLAGSFVCSEEGYAHLRFRTGSTYTGGWEGSASFDPLPNGGEGADILQKLSVLGGQKGEGKLEEASGSSVIGTFKNNMPDGYCTVTQCGSEGSRMKVEGWFEKGKLHGAVRRTTMQGNDEREYTHEYEMYEKGRRISKGVMMLPLCIPILLICALSRWRIHAQCKKIAKLGEDLSAKRKQYQTELGETAVKRPREMRPASLLAYVKGVILPATMFAYMMAVEELTSTWLAHILGMAGLALFVLVHNLDIRMNGTKPLRGSPVLTAFFMATVGMGTVFVYVRVRGRYSDIGDALFFTFDALLIILYAYVKWTEPGFLPTFKSMPAEEARQVEKKLGLKFRKVCETCGIIRPIRSKHCKDCDRCINHFDHHCAYMDWCVGANNHLAFNVFLIFFFAAQCVFFFILLKAGYMAFTSEEWEELGCPISYSCYRTLLHREFSIAMCISWNLFHFVFLLGLLRVHYANAVENTTTNERETWRRIKYMQLPYPSDVDAYVIPDCDMQVENEGEWEREVVTEWKTTRGMICDDAKRRGEEGKEKHAATMRAKKEVEHYLSQLNANNTVDDSVDEQREGERVCIRAKSERKEEWTRFPPFRLPTLSLSLAYLRHPPSFKVERAPTLEELSKRD